MRDAALTIAALGDDFAPSLLARALRAGARLLAEIRRTRLARHPRRPERLDARLLAATPRRLAEERWQRR